MLGRLADVAKRLTDCTSWAERFLAKFADAADRVINGLDEALQDLRIPVESCQRPIENVVKVLEPDLQHRLGLDTGDIHLYLAQLDMDTGDHL